MLKWPSEKLPEKNVNYDILMMILSCCFQFRKKKLFFFINAVLFDCLMVPVFKDLIFSKVMLRVFILVIHLYKIKTDRAKSFFCFIIKS